MTTETLKRRRGSDLRAECEEVEGRIRALNDELAEVALATRPHVD